MSNLIASELGKAKIQQARNERGWNVDDTKWLFEASKVLEPDKNWEDLEPFADGISLGTWKAFLYQMRGIRPQAFKAYCQVLGLNWEEVVERSPTQEKPSNEVGTLINLGIDYLRQGNCSQAIEYY